MKLPITAMFDLQSAKVNKERELAEGKHGQWLDLQLSQRPSRFSLPKRSSNTLERSSKRSVSRAIS